MMQGIVLGAAAVADRLDEVIGQLHHVFAPAGLDAEAEQLFAADAARLKQVIGRFGQILNSSIAQNYDFLVEGHTDNVGPENLNERIGLERERAMRFASSSRGASPASRSAAGMAAWPGRLA